MDRSQALGKSALLSLPIPSALKASVTDVEMPQLLEPAILADERKRRADWTPPSLSSSSSSWGGRSVVRRKTLYVPESVRKAQEPRLLAHRRAHYALFLSTDPLTLALPAAGAWQEGGGGGKEDGSRVLSSFPFYDRNLDSLLRRPGKNLRVNVK